MLTRKNRLLFLLAGFCIACFVFACKSAKPQTSAIASSTSSQPRVLVFAKTKGYHHESIADGLIAIQKLGRENKFSVDTTTDAGYFTEENLKRYAAVVFLSTTGDVLDADQQTALERFMQAGGGFAGVHAAADTEYDWPWYNKLVGAYFLSHPKQQKAVIMVKDKNHPSTSFLPDRWERFDEWYNYKSIMPDLHVLAVLDEKTYEGGKNGDNHPIAWYHEVDGGRAWYTGLGHTKESYTSDTLFLRHLLGGIKYAIGENKFK
jgi:type 1 glutamine amidotransferase